MSTLKILRLSFALLFLGLITLFSALFTDLGFKSVVELLPWFFPHHLQSLTYHAGHLGKPIILTNLKVNQLPLINELFLDLVYEQGQIHFKKITVQLHPLAPEANSDPILIHGEAWLRPFHQLELRGAFLSNTLLRGPFHLSLQKESPHWHWQLQGEAFEGSFNQLPFRGHFSAEGLDERWTKMLLFLQQANSTLSFQGDLRGKTPFLEGQLDLKTFEGLLPDRRLTLQGHLKWEQKNSDRSLLQLSVETPELPLPLTISQMPLRKTPEGWAFDGSAYWGTHPFQLSGQWHPNSPSTFDIHLQAPNIPYDDHIGTRLNLEPNLWLKGSTQHWEILGDVFVPSAHIERHSEQNTASTSPDVVIESPQLAKHQGGSPGFTWPRANILVTLGNAVYYSGYGLKTQIEGQLRLLYDTSTIQAQGELDFLQGQYKTFGRVFDITQGYLKYAGSPITEPQLLIRAQKTIWPNNVQAVNSVQEPVVVGVKISGEASSPTIRLFSEPALAEHDILSYLVFGQSQSDMTQDQLGILFQAAGAFSQGEWSQHPLIPKLPFDDIHLKRQPTPLTSSPTTTATDNSKESTATDPNALSQTALVVGKQLTPQLYVQYQTGMLDTLNSLHIQYSFGPHWMIQADTGVEASGADIVWSFDGK